MHLRSASYRSHRVDDSANWDLCGNFWIDFLQHRTMKWREGSWCCRSRFFHLRFSLQYLEIQRRRRALVLTCSAKIVCIQINDSASTTSVVLVVAVHEFTPQVEVGVPLLLPTVAKAIIVDVIQRSTTLSFDLLIIGNSNSGHHCEECTTSQVDGQIGSDTYSRTHLFMYSQLPSAGL